MAMVGSGGRGRLLLLLLLAKGQGQEVSRRQGRGLWDQLPESRSTTDPYGGQNIYNAPDQGYYSGHQGYSEPSADYYSNQDYHSDHQSEDYYGNQDYSSGHQIDHRTLEVEADPPAVLPGGFWGQIVKTNKDAETYKKGKIQSRSSSSGSVTDASASSSSSYMQKAKSLYNTKVNKRIGSGSGRRSSADKKPLRNLLVHNLQREKMDRMGDLEDDYYEYLDDYGDDIGNIDMRNDERPIDNLEAHR